MNLFKEDQLVVYDAFRAFRGIIGGLTHRKIYKVLGIETIRRVDGSFEQYLEICNDKTELCLYRGYYFDPFLHRRKGPLTIREMLKSGAS